MPATPQPTLASAVLALWGTVGGPSPQLWLDEVQEQEGYPRAALKMKGERPLPGAWDKASGQPIICEGFFDLEIAGENDSDAVEAIAILAMQTFKTDSLPLSMDPTAELFRTNYVLKGLGQRSRADKPLYQATISYRVVFGTNY